jgi:FkbM family methyltransferase
LWIYSITSKVHRRIEQRILGQDRFLESARGIIHIGANTGQERDLYARHNLEVAWIEPIPTVFETLCANLIAFPKQKAFQRLVAGRDRVKCTLHISNNGGESSSILELGAHREIWPEVSFTDSIELEGITLPSFIREECIDINQFDVLVLDTQGSELLILKGAIDILRHFRYIKSEVSDFEAYKGCCQLSELDAFMAEQGFRQKSRYAFAKSPEGGKYYDVLYQSRRTEPFGMATRLFRPLSSFWAKY